MSTAAPEGGLGWDAAGYLENAGHRERPFTDLLARVGAHDPDRVVDAGCGPGHLTARLTERWPRAVLEAFDPSPDMVAQARRRGVPAQLADAASWTPPPDTGVVVANAVLHWVPDHLDVLGRWARGIADGGWVAAALPGNAAAPSHSEVQALTESTRWAPQLAGCLGGSGTVADPADYAGVLVDAGCSPDVWETTYTHELRGPDPVLGWLSATTLRPVRSRLDDTGWRAFCAELAPRLRASYAADSRGSTWLPFRRVFAVGHRAAARRG